MRLAAWNLVNGQLRPTFLLGRSSRMRGRLSAPEVHAVTERWKSLAAWLEERGIRRLADCTAGVLHDYGQHARDAGHSRSHVMKTLAALTPAMGVRPAQRQPCRHRETALGGTGHRRLPARRRPRPRGEHDRAPRRADHGTAAHLGDADGRGPVRGHPRRLGRTAAPHLGCPRRHRHASRARRPGGIPPAPDRRQRAPALDPQERQGRPRRSVHQPASPGRHPDRSTGSRRPTG